ncbi:MAG: hypothetical protein K2I23_07640, partial [Clostridia bacterium]|nr:hypothetical protein [Clostridia bacterium]
MIFAKKKTKSFYTSICIVLTMLIVLSLAITLIGNSNTDNITQADTIAGSPAASVLNLSANGGEKDNFSSLLSGAQNEYIYFGTKSGSAIKWRVLSNNDTKYSNGSILLWSDSSLGSEQYNPYSDNPNYAYWGTSKIRAMLNSGTYLSTVSNDAAVPSFNQPVAEDNSFLYKSFDKNERNSIVKTKEYETKLWGFDGKATPAFKTTGIVGSSSGQYDSSNVNNVAGTYASVVNNTSVVEKTSEDSLFLLDYYDINNDSYGFVDSDGKTYANKVIPSWTSSSAGYPGYNDNGNNGSITANYLKDGEVDYFLRSVGRISASSYIIFVNASVGHVSSYQVSSTYGVRPAFNLNPSSVIYATAASVASNEAVFAPVNSVSASEGKPAYKVYFKADSYINFNDSTDLDGVPEIFPANGTIKVKKSGQSGSVVILLADKTGDGSVAYQATASFNDGVATATLPSGVKAKDYNITVLFADSIKGGEFAESITGSYTYQGLAIPKNVSVEYNGAQRTVGDFSSEEWYDSSIYADSSIMTVVIPTAINVNTYTVSFTIKDTADVEWIGGNKGKKEITLTITSKPLGVSWSTSEEGIAVPSLIDSQLCSNASGVKDTVKLNLNYTGRNSNAGYDSTTVPRVIGDYTVTITSLSNSNYTLDETAVDSQDFTKTETNIPVPTFFPKSSYNYNGSVRTYELELGGDFKGDYTVHVPTDFTGKYDLNKTVTTDGMVTVKATNAGTYELEVRLTDPQNTQWKLSNGTVTKDSQKLQFKILPLPLELQIVTDTNTIDCELGEDFDLYVQAQTRPKLGESVLLDFYVQRVGSESETLVYSNFEFDSTMSDFTIKLKLSEVEIPSNYKLVIKVKNKDGSSDYVNYETILDDIIFNIKEKVDVNSTIFWQLRINGAIKTSMYFDIDIDYTPKFDKIPLVYSGKEYSFTASLPSGYSVDRTYSVDGYTNGYKDAKFTNAGEYTTTARVNTPDGTKEYSIKWTIEQAKFDLSNVKWQYDGQLPYDKVNGSEAILDPKALPAGLVPNYFNNTGTTVGTSGSASVTFTLASGYEGNYVLPDESDKDSYVDPNDGFEWSKPWNIVKATIQSSSWKNTTATDSNNHAFGIPVLRDPKADGGIVEYEYYETDSMGNILDANNPLKKSDIVWSESEAKFYIAKPILQDTQNYQLDNPNSQSKVFRVGKELAKVSVSLEKTQVEYNTNPRHAKVKVADSALPTTAFDLIYYDGYTRLSNAPTEVGKYRVEVSLKNTYMDRYQIDGDYEFDYEIVKAKISTDWNENAKPPVLKLTYGQVNGVEYEIIDSGENLVEYKNLKAGVTYKIRARIKDNQLDKFIFDDDSTETDWKTFSVTANDLDNLKNPDSPDNPAYPQKDPELPTQDEDPTDPNGPGSGNVPGSGDEGGSGSLGDIIEKLKDIPLWQLIASVISIILIIVFLSKTAGNESKRKKFNKKANKLESSVYAGAFLG